MVLTEHTKPVKSGYKEVLGWYNPMTHETQADLESIKAWIAKGALPSNRTAKLLFNLSKDEFFKTYIVYTDRVRKPTKEPEEAPAAPAPASAEEVAETPVTEEVAVEETPAVEEAPVAEEVTEAPAAEEAPTEEAAE
ncbi:MAG: 30S ribosomal protein S16 [Candidatus Peribacteria bacterium]|nr:MAG: 30S ribosomal protein S16 [Candidatus Peribacteria bacterium]